VSCYKASTRLERNPGSCSTMPSHSVGPLVKLKNNRLCVQVMSTAVGRTLPSVVTGTLALVHASGAVEPITFLNLEPSIQDLEYLACLITAHIRRKQVTAGTRSEHRVDEEGTALLGWQQEVATGDAIVIENELQPSALTDIYRRPCFVDITPSGTSPPQYPAAQQAALLSRLSAWDSNGYALLRTAPCLISHRATVCCDATTKTVTVTIAPDGAMKDDESNLKARSCLDCSLALLLLVLLSLVLWRGKSSSHTQQMDDLIFLSITIVAPMLVLMLTVHLVGYWILEAPRDVTLTIGTTSWKLESHLKGFKLFPFLRSTSTGETNACCGCQVCAFCLPPLHN
jgi:hypothetical protein